MVKKIARKKVASKEYTVTYTGEEVSEAVEQALLKEDSISLFGNEQIADEYLQIPADITEVDSRDLGRYFGAFTQQKMYVRGLVGKLAAMKREKERELDAYRSEVYLSLPVKMSMKEKELHFASDPRTQKPLEEVYFIQERLIMTSDYLDSLIDGITLISREISRREGDWKDNRREDNISTKRR